MIEETWSSALASPEFFDDFDIPDPCDSSCFTLNTRWIDDLLCNSDCNSDQSVPLEHECQEGVTFYKGSSEEFAESTEVECRCIQVTNIPPGVGRNELANIFERENFAIESIEIEANGRAIVRLYDLREARVLRVSRIAVNGRSLIMSYGDAKPVENKTSPPNNGTIALFGLQRSVTDNVILQFFSEYGHVRQVRESPSANGPRFVEFWDSRDAAKALRAVKQKKPFGRKVHANYSLPSGFKEHLRKCYSKKLPTIERRER